VPFAYYRRLSLARKKIYDLSDRVTEVRLADPASLFASVEALRIALELGDRGAVERASRDLAAGINLQLNVPRVTLKVLAVRPSYRWGEMHGQYTAEQGKIAHIHLWMRTARAKKPVAFRAFLRTLLHELGHHHDYTLLKLGHSFHTEGFFKRESSLFGQLVPKTGGKRRGNRISSWMPEP